MRPFLDITSHTPGETSWRLLPFPFGDPTPDSFGDPGREEGSDGPTEAGNLTNQRRRHVRPLRRGRHEDGVDPSQLSVHLCHLQLIVEVRNESQTFDDGPDAVDRAEINKQPVEECDGDVIPWRTDFGEHVDSLGRTEEGVLGHVVPHGDDDFVEQPSGSFDDVEMPRGRRIERPRADSSAHGSPSVVLRLSMAPNSTTASP